MARLSDGESMADCENVMRAAERAAKRWPPGVRRWALGPLALLALLWVGLAGALAQAPADEGLSRARVEALRGELQQMEAALGNRDLGDLELQRLRQRADPILDELRRGGDDLTQRAEQAKARLEQLGPKPAANAPAESAELAAERATRGKALAEADEAARLARALLLQTEQIISGVADKRRALFARTLFASGPSLLSPALWVSLVGSLPQDVRAFRLLVTDWLGAIGAQAGSGRLALVLLALCAGVALYLARQRYLPVLMARLGAEGDTTRLERLGAAVLRLAAGALPAALASWLVYAALTGGGFVPFRLQPFLWALLGGLALLAFVGALADATLAPKWPQRRVFPVTDRQARDLKRMAAGAAAVLVTSKLVETILQAIAAGLSLSIAVRAGFALLFALVLALGLSRLRDPTQSEAEASLGPYVARDAALSGPLRLLGWLLALAIAGAALSGYVAFASFLADQAMWAAIVITLVVLALMLADESLQRLLAGDSTVSKALQTNVGLRKRALEQLAVVSTGVIKLTLLVIGGMLVLAPWGVESSDLTSSLRAAFFGFKVGDVTISLSAIIIAGVLFALGLAATRALTRWLDDRFLPATDLDVGLRNSLKTIAGYVGFVAALALAISSLGLSLERLTIVAGALSVGIGFGLQSIVSNFVSGLILLWERPIRVGDLIVVGDGEGVVKRINVRSTEIETFDRSTVIVPNSNLISGVVKNRVRSDRSGRVIVSLSVPRMADARRVNDVLLSVAADHPQILDAPPPRVLFKKITDASLDFDLICIVPDVDLVGIVASDLHFAIFERLRAEGIGQPEREVAVKGLDRIEDTLEELVDTIEDAQEAQTAALQARRKPVAAATQPEPPQPPPAAAKPKTRAPS